MAKKEMKNATPTTIAEEKVNLLTIATTMSQAAAPQSATPSRSHARTTCVQMAYPRRRVCAHFTIVLR